MKHVIHVSAIAVAAVVSLPASGPDEDVTVMVKRMARIGSASSPTFSPDGTQLAFVTNITGTPQLWTIEAQGGYPRLLTNDDDPVQFAVWSPTSDRVAYVVAPGGGLNTQIHVIRANGAEARRLTAGGKENNQLGDWTRDGQFITMSSNLRDGASLDSYLLDPATGKAELVAKNPGIGQIANVSADGRRAVLFRLKSRGDNNLYLLDLQARKETLLTSHTPPASFFGEIAPDGSTVYLSSNDKRDLSAFGRIPLGANGDVRAFEVLAERSDAELDGFEVNQRGTAAALAWNVGGRTEIDFIDLQTRKVTRGPALPAELAGGFEFSPDDRQLALVLSGAAAPADIWMMDVNSLKLRQLTFSPHAGVNLAEFVKPELVKYKAHDGLELTGWLYRPKAAGPAPFVLSFHGGPEGQERPSFRSDYQALLLRGIGVFAPNVRGSSGFGKKFVNSDNGKLRLESIRDIRASVDFLVMSAIADPKRLGITGGSYGGYMTMVGLTEFPELFAAGADLFGIVNFATFFKHSEPWMAAISTIEYGDPATETDLLAQLSPIHKLDRIRAPLLVMHGANDTNVPVIEAEQIVEHLKKRGVPVEYLLFPDEGHGWRKMPNRIKSTVTLVDFFTRHLNPQTATASK